MTQGNNLKHVQKISNMAYEPKNGDISIFKNENKTSENAPDYTGYYINEQGERMEVSLWLKEAGNGKKFLSGRVRKKDAQKPASNAAPVQVPQHEIDDLPF